jgi:hypothetical protein
MPTTYVRAQGDRRPQKSLRSIRFYVPAWVDPYYYLQGSVPEKMVMAEFVRRGIYFQHTPQSNELGGLVDPPREADFWVPPYKIWIEVNGFYFHTLKGVPERDAYRYAVLEQAGIRVIVWWDYDILDHLKDLMDSVPEFYHIDTAKQRGKKTEGLPFFEGGDGVDHLAGLRKALSNRAGPQYISDMRRSYDVKRKAKIKHYA